MIYTDEQIINSAFEHFRKAGFPYRKFTVHECMQEINKLAELPDDKLETSVLAYQVADTYHPERFSTPVTGMKTPIEAFYDDKILRRCLTRMLTKGTGIKQTLIGGVGGIAITSGTQAAANFRPAYALKVYREYCRPGDNILDTSAGFGGRLIGAIAFGECSYVGIDPSPDSYKGNLKMAQDLGKEFQITLWNYPVEDIDPDTTGFTGTFDFAFTSPPYLFKELYSDDGRGTQSWARYKTGEEWKKGFLDKMLEFQFKSLKTGKYSLVNIEDVTIKKITYPLVEWCIQAGEKAGFTYKGTTSFRLQKRIGSGHENSEIAKESVLIFRKC